MNSEYSEMPHANAFSMLNKFSPPEIDIFVFVCKDLRHLSATSLQYSIDFKIEEA